MDVREFLRHLATLPGYAGQMSSTHEASRAGHTHPHFVAVEPHEFNSPLGWKVPGREALFSPEGFEHVSPKVAAALRVRGVTQLYSHQVPGTPSRHILPSDVLSLGRGRRGGGSWSACGGHHGDCLGQVPLLLYSDRRRHRQR